MNNNKLNIKNDKFADLVGIELLELGEGYAEVRMEITENHLNGENIPHGGALFTLADYAFAAASNYTSPVTLAINASISFFKAPKGKVLTARAREVTTQNKLCGYEVEILDENNELVAKFSGTGYIKRKKD